LARVDFGHIPGLAARFVALPADVPEETLRGLYLEVRWVLRRLVLANPLLDFDKLLFVKRGEGNLGLPQNWQGNSFTIGGIHEKPKSAKYLASGKAVKCELNGTRLVFSDLPEKSPDDVVTVITAEFETAPVQDSMGTRIVVPFIQLIHDEVAKGWG